MGFESVGEVLMWRASLFYRVGAVPAKAWSPLCINLDLGTATSIWSKDLRNLAGVYQLKVQTHHISTFKILSHWENQRYLLQPQFV